MSVSVIVPFHASDEWRVKAWEYVSAWWCKHFPDWELIRCTADPYTKGAALHEGVKIAEGSTLILADADSFILDPDELAELASRVDRKKDPVPWLMPHRYVHRVSKAATERIYDDGVVDIHDIAYPIYGGCVGGGMTVLTRQAWKTVKGVDERFSGWGGEDRCFGWALSSLVPGGQRGNARLIHLFHEKQGPRQQMSRETLALINEYRHAKSAPSRMAAYIAARKQ
jgi:hypothetical protein